MPRLDCSVKNCYYNKDSKCCREGIKVGGHDATVEDATYCSDFKERHDSFSSDCKCDTNPSKTLEVYCNAVKCVYNDNEKCRADKIGIKGNGAKHESQTECGTFKCS